MAPRALEGAVKGVLFDLDGTLYRQGPLRRLMMVELVLLPATAGFSAVTHWRVVSTFRKMQEQLRHTEGASAGSNVLTTQVEQTARRLGLPVGTVAPIVDEWMFRRPLRHLPACRAEGVVELLDWMETRGLRAGILSDYPATDKIEALGLAGRFAPVLCASDADINALKPRPEGFLRAAEAWHLRPDEVLVVGDRPEVDAVGAAAAGMPAAIVGRHAPPPGAEWIAVPNMEALRRVLDNRC
jgi:FMN phosphatase YigB (HAD superfamily)